MAWVSPATQSTGDVVTATEWNEVVGDLKIIGDAWTSYTPVIAQGVTTNIAKTITYAKYVAAGKLVMVNGMVALTAAGTAGSAITASMPVTSAVAAGVACGTGWFYDASAVDIFVVTAVLSTTTQLGFYATSASGGRIGEAAGAFTGALASGDVLTFSIQYESA